LTVCGWLLYVLRYPRGTGIFPLKHKRKLTGGESNANIFNINTSCKQLEISGLNDSLFELLVLVHGSSSVDEIVENLNSNMSFGAKIMARMHLRYFYNKFRLNIEVNTNFVNSFLHKYEK
jgi:hypothetical protein